MIEPGAHRPACQCLSKEPALIDDVERCRQRIAAIRQQLAEDRPAVSATVLADIRECVRLFGFTAHDIFGEAAGSQRDTQ
ncbi:MAG: hypothetical protein V4764_13485 [Burkholderia sp.]